jgi:hypothetical protein
MLDASADFYTQLLHITLIIMVSIFRKYHVEKVGRCVEHRKYYLAYTLGILAYPQILIFNYLILLGNTKTK